jgi:hypothetical protein
MPARTIKACSCTTAAHRRMPFGRFGAQAARAAWAFGRVRRQRHPSRLRSTKHDESAPEVCPSDPDDSRTWWVSVGCGEHVRHISRPRTSHSRKAITSARRLIGSQRGETTFATGSRRRIPHWQGGKSDGGGRKEAIRFAGALGGAHRPGFRGGPGRARFAEPGATTTPASRTARRRERAARRRERPRADVDSRRAVTTAAYARAFAITCPTAICAAMVAASTPTAASIVRPKEDNVSSAGMSPPGAPRPVLESMGSAP